MKRRLQLVRQLWMHIVAGSIVVSLGSDVIRVILADAPPTLHCLIIGGIFLMCMIPVITIGRKVKW